MEIHHGSADRGESGPGQFDHRRFRSLCHGFRLEADFGVLDRTQHVTFHVVNHG